MTIPSRDQFDTLEEWVDAVSESLDVPAEHIWDIVEELKPGAKVAATGDPAERLKRLFRHHSKYMQNQLEDVGRPDPDCWIDVYLDGENKYQFLWPGHNATSLDSEMKERMLSIVDDEGMEIQSEGENYVAAFLSKSDPEEDVRIAGRILEEVYDADFSDIEKAVEVRGEDRFSWSDELSANGSENSSREDEEYDSWVFCQSCGERISDPETNPRFCEKCRG